MGTEPTEEELRSFVDSMLSNLDRGIREPDVIDEAIRGHRKIWVMLYRASLGFDARDEESPKPPKPA